MRWAIIFSLVLHLLAVLALWQQSMPTVPPPSEVPDMPAEMEVLLSDPTRGAPGAEQDAPPDPPDEASPPATSPPPPEPPRPIAETAPPDTAPPDTAPPEKAPAETPPAETPPERAKVEPVPPDPSPDVLPVPPPPVPQTPPALAPTATTPTPPAPPSAPRQARAPPQARVGASAEGRDNGLTDIVTGSHVVPPGTDPRVMNIPPRYPLEAVRRGQQGNVMLNVLVATDGSVISVDVAQSSGFPLLDRAARDAVAKWRFRPGMRDGLAVPSTIPVPLTFVLEH